MYGAALGFCIGAILGSFSKAVSERLIIGGSLRGRSYCLSCKKTLRWYDLFPILSYLTLKGKCRYCHKKIPSDVFAIEIISGILFAILYWSFIYSQTSLVLLLSQNMWLVLFDILFKTFVVTVLLIVFLTDFQSGFIFDRLTYPSIAISLGYILFLALFKILFFHQADSLHPSLFLSTIFWNVNTKSAWFSVILNVATGIISGGGFLLLLILTRGKGMGGGDVKLAFFLGFALGFPKTIVALFLSFLLGSVVSIGLILLKRKKISQTIPFGPFLALGAYLAIVFGSALLSFYLKLLN